MLTLRRLGLLTIASGLFFAMGHRASAQVSVSIGAPPFALTGTTKFHRITALQMDTMARNGSPTVSSSVLGPGFTDRSISTDTSIITTTIATATMVHCPQEVSMRQRTGPNFTAKQCMTRTGMKHRAATILTATRNSS